MFFYIRYICFLIVFGFVLSFFSRCIPANYGTSFSPFELTSENEENEENEEDDDDEEDEEEEEDDDDEEDDDIDKTQIPYDMVLDTMALSTCEDLTDGFNFKMASLYEGGIKLKDLMKDKTKSEIREYSYYKASPFLGFTQQDSNGNYHILSWEKQGHRFAFNGGRSFDNRIDNIESYLNQLIETFGVYLKTTNQLRGRGNGGDPISVSFQHSFARSFNPLDQYETIIGFRRGDPLTYKDVEEGEQYIHGRYYEINTREDDNGRIYLNGVEERNPKTNFDTRWNCPNDLQLEIRRHESNIQTSQAELEEYFKEYDIPEDYISDEEPCNNNPNHRLHGIVQQMLGSDWNINLDEKCISPKSKNKNKCYNGEIIRVVSSSSKNCSPDLRLEACPHLISFCIRSLSKLEEYL